MAVMVSCCREGPKKRQPFPGELNKISKTNSEPNFFFVFLFFFPKFMDGAGLHRPQPLLH